MCVDFIFFVMKLILPVQKKKNQSYSSEFVEFLVIDFKKIVRTHNMGESERKWEPILKNIWKKKIKPKCVYVLVIVIGSELFL